MDTFKDLEKAVLAKVCNHGTRSLRKGGRVDPRTPLRMMCFIIGAREAIKSF